MTSPRRTFSSALSPWALVLIPSMVALSSAHAQPTEQARLDLATEADIRFELGVEAQRRADYRSAVAHYLASHRLVPNQNVVFNIAACFEALDRFPEAYRYYSDYLEGELEPEDRRVAEAAVQRIRPRVALIRVATDPPGAAIYLDRRDLGARGRSPRTLAVEPGSHTILVEADGYEDASSEALTASLGQEVEVSLELEQILGQARVVGEPQGAEIRVDDEESEVRGTVPATLDLVPGLHTLIVSAPGRQRTRYQTTITASTESRVEIDLPLETGAVVVDAEERGALIELDGEPVGFTPTVLPEVPSGRHTIRIARTGFRPYEEEIEVRPHERTTVGARLRLTAEVTAASREAQSVDDAPASVSIISQEELRAFGYQTLWDAVLGQRGIYPTNDLTYLSLGLRGFSQPSDYGNRVLVLTDGHTMNDDLLGSSYVGYDARADLLDVQRIELVRGAGSALYGTNAFFGVLNVVTRDRDSLMPPHASVATDENRMVRGRVGGGARISRDVGFWLSAGAVYSQGDDYTFAELPEAGTITNADSMSAFSTAARGWAGDFTLQLSFNRRDKRIPTGAFDSIPGDPRTNAVDTRGFVELRWEPHFGRELDLYVRAFGDLYLYEGNFAYEGEEGEPSYAVRDRWEGVWVGGEVRGVWSPWEWLRLTAGSEVRGSALAELTSRVDEEAPYLNPEGSDGILVAGGYLVANVTPIPEIRIDLGGRIDYVNTFGDVAGSPRAAVIFRPWEGGVLKLLGGSAFRAPSVYELRYNDDGETQIAAVSLSPERIWSGELEVSQRIEDVVLLVSTFYNRIENLITTADARYLDPGTGEEREVLQYQNVGEVAQTVGAEAEIRRELRQGWMIGFTYSFQRTRIGDLLSDAPEARLTNSPEHLVGVRGIVSLIPDVLVLASRLRVEGPRLGRLPNGSDVLVEGDVPVVWDIVASGEIAATHLSWGLGVRNVLDWRYGYPGGDDLAQSFVPQRGRTFFAQLTLTL